MPTPDYRYRTTRVTATSTSALLSLSLSLRPFPSLSPRSPYRQHTSQTKMRNARKVFDKLELSMYSMETGTLSVNDIFVSDQQSREVDMDHVDGMYQEMLRDGYPKHALGLITVGKISRTVGGNTTARYEICDGLHRHAVGKRAVASDDDSEKATTLRNTFLALPVSIVSRKDNKDLVTEDLLFLSQALNAKAHRVLATRPRDFVHTAISMYNAVGGKFAGVELKTAAAFASYLEHRLFGSVHKAKALSYATVSLKMMSSPLTYEAFKVIGSVNDDVALVILKNSAFTSAHDRASLLMLDCLMLRKKYASRHQAFGRIKLLVRDYLLNIRAYYTCMRNLADRFQKDIAELYSIPDLRVSGNASFSTVDVVYGFVTEFEHPDARSASAQNARMESFEKLFNDRYKPCLLYTSPSPRDS